MQEIRMTVQAQPETLSFQAEAAQILDLVVHSLYSNKEIFLRELISNAADAIGRLRLEMLAQSKVPEDEGPLQIRVSFDADAGTITVADNGVGMSRQEVIEHIGTIAKSGTQEFLRALSGDQFKDAALIGQFGVGFYSVFIVADKVSLTTRRAGLPAKAGVRWTSDGRSVYTLETIERPDPGTTIVLYLREGEDDLLNAYRLRSMIQRYSDHISAPIMMPADKLAEIEDELEDDELEDGEAGDGEAGDGEAGHGEAGHGEAGDGEAGHGEAGDGEVGHGEAGHGEAGDGEVGHGEAGDDEAEDDETDGYVRVNQSSAFWTRPKSELSDEDYAQFYRHITNDYGDPIAYLHTKIEGNYEYTLLLFIPPRAPLDLWGLMPSRGIRLHVQRVFIMEDSRQLMPDYLRFIRGVIDSSDLPLNVSRELLQGSRAVEIIRTNATKKVLKLLSDLAENEPEKYATFWDEFGAILKEGISDDYSNRDDIARLLRFASTVSANGDPDVSLSDYVARMKEGQEKIYYVMAPSLATAEGSPHLEAFREKGIEVLLLNDGIDNWVVSSLREFEGRRLQSVAHGTTDFGALENEEEKDAGERASTEFAGLVGRLKEALGDRVWDVRVTTRLTSSPACIVSNEAEADVFLSHQLQEPGLPVRPVLEINPQHLLVARLPDEPDEERFSEWAHVLYNQAVLTLGARIDDPGAFVGQLNSLLVTLLQSSQPEIRAPRKKPMQKTGRPDLNIS
jgi:molecular chaperone HtpG